MTPPTEPQTHAPANSAVSNPNVDPWIALLSPLVQPLGYQIIHVEIQLNKPKTLRLFIDHAPARAENIGIEDCVKVTKALDEQLDHLTEIDAAFKGAYELEVSSPGVDRTLRTFADFEKHVGDRVRAHLYRPLTAEETGNATYTELNPKQKNYLGFLKQSGPDALELEIENAKGARVQIPLRLISKIHLEPVFDFIEGDSR